MKKLVIANWKMNPKTVQTARTLFMSIEHRMPVVAAYTEVGMAVPFVFIPPLTHYSHMVKLGAQNVSWAESGALTGEISGVQLKAWDVEFVILGHSERRIYLGETDSMVNEKIKACLQFHLTPVVCLGGEIGAKKADMQKLVTKQFNGVTKGIEKSDLHKLVYVYEPVWAISTMKNSKPATGEHAAELIEHIQFLLAKKLGQQMARNARILYGGTVNRHNVQEFSKYPVIDGALVGAAGLDSDNFYEIIKEFNREAIHKEMT